IIRGLLFENRFYGFTSVFTKVKTFYSFVVINNPSGQVNHICSSEVVQYLHIILNDAKLFAKIVCHFLSVISLHLRLKYLVCGQCVCLGTMSIGQVLTTIELVSRR